MFELKPLKYSYEALEPYISAETMRLHHQKHHQAYIDNLNKLIQDNPIADLSLEQIVQETYQDSTKTAIFNNAAQALNHDIFWDCLRPVAETRKIPEVVLSEIEKNFSSLDNFKAEFKEQALSQFGSGWAWLAQKEDGSLIVLKTSNAENVIVQGLKPLFALDLWEHAYYLDYQNKRAAYLEAVLDNLVNWDFIAKELKI